MAKKIIILGYGEWLNYAYDLAEISKEWISVEKIELKKINKHQYDLGSIPEPDHEFEYFLALDGSGFGTVREKHLSELVGLGYKFTAISPFGSNGLPLNSLISEINSGVRGESIKYNSFFGPGVHVGLNFSAGKSITLGPNIIIRNNVTLEKNVSINKVELIEDNITVGSFSSIENMPILSMNIKSKTIFNRLFARLVTISN